MINRDLHKFYLPVFGSGLGHIARTYSLACRLRRSGDQFLYSSFDEALDFLYSKGERALKCPSIDLRWNDVGGFSSRGSFLRFPHALSTFTRQVAFETENINRFQPDIVIADSRLSGVFASKLRSRTTITILNQFKVLFPPRFRSKVGSAFYEKIEGNILGLFWTLGEEVLMPDLPPPYTISESNVSGVDVSGKLRYIGFMTEYPNISARRLGRVKNDLGIDNRPLIFVQISGPRGSKTSFERSSENIVGSLSRKYNIIISLGRPDGSLLPRKLSNNSWIYEWCPIKDELFQLADVVVGRAGHTTISQCILNSKPAVYIPISNHSEQIWNSSKCEKLGIGVQLRSENLNEENLALAIEQCYTSNEMRHNLDLLSSISRKYKGIDNAERIVQSYL